MSWDERLKELKQYKQVNGNCNVPQHYKANPQLANWVTNHRQFYKKGNLSSDQIKLLERLGFSWNPEEDRWNEMFEQLVQFNVEHKHCNVPQRFKDNPQLGTWVETQRAVYNKKKKG